MDMITLSMAKSYTDSQRIAYEENSVITWDGNTDGLTYIEPFGSPMYRVSDKLIPPGDVQITLFDGLTMPGVLSELLPGFVASNEGIVISAKAGEYGDGEETVSLPESGTYLAYEDGNAMNIASISFETIVPIDQKYLGGVCLPVVELSTPISIGATFTDAENAALYKAFNADAPFVLRCSIATKSSGTFTDCKVVAFSAKGTGFNVIAFSVLHVQVSMQSVDGSTWQAGIGEG